MCIRDSAKIGWNWPSGSGEDFLNFVNIFSLFCYYLFYVWTNLNPLRPQMVFTKFGSKKWEKFTTTTTTHKLWSEKLTSLKKQNSKEFIVLGSVILTAASKHSFRPAFVRALVSQNDAISLFARACPSSVVIRYLWLGVDLRSKTKKTCWTS